MRSQAHYPKGRQGQPDADPRFPWRLGFLWDSPLSVRCYVVRCFAPEICLCLKRESESR